MAKIDKVLNLKLISICIGVFVLINTDAHNLFATSNKGICLRNNLLTDSIDKDEGINRLQTAKTEIMKSMGAFQIVSTEEIKKRFDAKKSSERSLLIGFMRDSEDRIQPIFSNSSEFQSTRELESQDGIVLFGTGWNPEREAREIPLAISGKKDNIHFTRLDKTDDWEMLPDEIKEILDNGNILVTSSKVNNGYSVLMAVTPADEWHRSEGRTGVLLKDGMPIVVRIEDKEFIVEIKGVGNAEGGFDGDYKFLRGGIQIEESEREFNSLEMKRKIGKSFNQGEAVRAVAHINFNIDDREQGYLIRLSLGSVRATYNKNVAFGTLERAERIRRVAYDMGRQMAEFFSEGFIPCSHPENLIAVDTEKKFIFTDYSDIIPIDAFLTELEGYRYDLYDIIERSLNTVTEISGYSEHNGFNSFKEGLADGLEEVGKISREEKSKLIGLGKFEELRDFFWKKFLAYDYYKARKIYGWTPTFFKFLQDSIDTEFITQIAEKARRKYADNNDKISRVYSEREKEKYRKENQLLENTGFTAEGIITMTNSLEARRSFEKGIQTLNPIDIWKAEYYVIWDLWGDNFSDFMLVANYLKKEIEFLEIVLDSVDTDLSDNVRKNLKIARDRLNTLRKLTPYEYYKKLIENPQYSKDMSMLPYFSKTDLGAHVEDIQSIINNQVGL